jgi:integral membrane protein (TIGR01906 family)
MKILAIFSQWVFILCLPVLLATASMAWAANSVWLYRAGFEKYDVGQTTGLSDSELEKAATGLIHYFRSGEEYVSITVVKDGRPFELFTEEEIIHFRDVKGLLWLDYRVLLGTLLYCLAYAGVSLVWQRRRNWRRLAWAAVGGSSLTLALMLAIGLAALVNFDSLFLQFHLISFANKFWSARGYMVLLFPRGFWYDTVLLCAAITAGLAVLLGGVAGAYLLFRRKTAVP